MIIWYIIWYMIWEGSIWIVYSVCYLAQRDNMTTEDSLINILFKMKYFKTPTLLVEENTLNS